MYASDNVIFKFMQICCNKVLNIEMEPVQSNVLDYD